MVIVDGRKLTLTESTALMATKPVKAIALTKETFASRADTLVICGGGYEGFYYPPVCLFKDEEDDGTAGDRSAYGDILTALVRDNKAKGSYTWPWN